MTAYTCDVGKRCKAFKSGIEGLEPWLLGMAVNITQGVERMIVKTHKLTIPYIKSFTTQTHRLECNLWITCAESVITYRCVNKNTAKAWITFFKEILAH